MTNKRKRTPGEGKRKRVANDAQWCLRNVETLNLQGFATQFGLDKQYATKRYQDIVKKYTDEETRESLLQDLKGWKKSVASTEFWQEQERRIALAITRSACSRFVNQTIQEKFPRGSSNNNNGSSSNNDNDNNNNNNNNNNNGSSSDASSGISHNNNNNSSLENDDSGSSTPMEEYNDPFMIKDINVSDLFQQYRQYISSHYSSFIIKKDIQEIMAATDILFLAPSDHSVY
ncbi:hypothetical protein BDA99DRAFT_53905 [Phascolomyces articulosus]|uniref:Uncharacterized protein n=1 Tax=Phascolomyces articulosus TaxID=60185 RepID=A0AAD5K197_9FUNG|nr:hypothetical protein BDA99DRAFT_53905 [Phascolomyces articulosus]